MKRRRTPRPATKTRQALLMLYEADKTDTPFVRLNEFFHEKTARALLNNAYAFVVVNNGERLYRITTMGRQVASIKRPNLVCPRCNQRLRSRKPSGRLNKYCRECPRQNPQRLCPRCKINTCATYTTGNPSSYCHDCEMEMGRKRREARKTQKCFADGCSQLRWSSTAYCYEHYKRYRLLKRLKKRGLA